MSLHQILLQTSQLSIEIIEYEGELLPRLLNASLELVKYLQGKGAEILTVSAEEGEYLVYMKLYSQEEQHQNDGGNGFHCGYSLESFFEEHKDLIPFVSQLSVGEVADFLDKQTLDLLLFQQKD